MSQHISSRINLCLQKMKVTQEFTVKVLQVVYTHGSLMAESCRVSTTSDVIIINMEISQNFQTTGKENIYPPASGCWEPTALA